MFSRRQTVTKQWVMAAALAFGASGVALADGSSMDPFTGDSYAFFNGGCNKQNAAHARTAVATATKTGAR